MITQSQASSENRSAEVENIARRENLPKWGEIRVVVPTGKFESAGMIISGGVCRFILPGLPGVKGYSLPRQPLVEPGNKLILTSFLELFTVLNLPCK